LSEQSRIESDVRRDGGERIRRCHSHVCTYFAIEIPKFFDSQLNINISLY
jgi:hypothetical protein